MLHLNFRSFISFIIYSWGIESLSNQVRKLKLKNLRKQNCNSNFMFYNF